MAEKKRPPTRGTRRGNGAGWGGPANGPGYGPGWGGPARGAHPAKPRNLPGTHAVADLDDLDDLAEAELPARSEV